MTKRDWYRRALVGIEVGPTGAQFGTDRSDAFASRFDGRAIVRASLDIGAEYLVIWAKDGEFAYYDSEIVPKAPGLRERDVLRETVDAARNAGLPVVAYCEMQHPVYLLRDEPRYRMLDVDGRDIPGRVCFNSGYLDHVKPIVDEVASYGIHGFHFDMMDQGFGPPYGCWCHRCRDRYESTYARPMPAGAGWDADWARMLEFRYASSESFERDLTEHVRSVDADLTVDFNHHGAPPFSWETGQRPVQHAHIGDFATGECGVWAFGALHASFGALFAEATKPDGHYQMVMQRNVRMYHDMTLRPVADMLWEAATLLAHGAQVTVVDKTPYDGALDPVAYSRIGEMFAETHRNREHFAGRPIREVGLYYSAKTRDQYGRDDPDKYQQAMLGVHKALVYAHIPVGFILDENVTAERLSAFPVVCLPNVAVLAQREVDLLTAYVEDGGALVTTGVTGLYGPLGEELPEGALADLAGVRLIACLDERDVHVALNGECDAARALSADIPTDWPFLVHGQATAYEMTTATPYGRLYRPHRTSGQRAGDQAYHLPLSPDVPIGPAILVNAVGKGTVATVCASPGVAFAGEYRNVEPRLLIRNLIRLLHPEPEVAIDAPTFVESVVTEDAAARLLRVHLIGCITPPQNTGPGRPHSNRVLPSMMEDTPLYRVRVRLRREFRAVQALGPDTVVTRIAGGVEAVVSGIHEALVFSY